MGRAYEQAGSGRNGGHRGGVAGRLGMLTYPVFTVLAAIAGWQLVVALFRIPVFLLPAPTAVAAEMVRSLPLLLEHSFQTLQEILLGFGLSVVVGIALAVLIVTSRPVECGIYPLLVASQVVPKIAVAPLFIVWFGYGMTPKVLVAVLIAVFPVIISTVIGLRSVEQEKLYLIRSMGATRYQAFSKVQFPHALPYLFGGLKISITLAVVGAIVGEFIGADKGIGRLLLIANGTMDTPLLFAGIGALTLMGIVLFAVLDAVERVTIPWHVSRRLIETGAGTL